MLFNEPKLLKCRVNDGLWDNRCGFSALQRAEIAEIPNALSDPRTVPGFSALQRAEIAEILTLRTDDAHR